MEACEGYVALQVREPLRSPSGSRVHKSTYLIKRIELPNK